MRLARLFREDFGGERAAVQLAHIHNQGAVAVFHVATGALTVAACGQFGQLVFQRNAAVLRFATLRRPATMRITVLDGEIQCRPVCTGLPAGNDAFAEE